MSSNQPDQPSSHGEKTTLQPPQALRSSTSKIRSPRPLHIQPSPDLPEPPQPLPTQRSHTKTSQAHTSATPKKTTTDTSTSSSHIPNPTSQMKSRPGYLKEDSFSRTQSQRKTLKRPRVNQDDFRSRLERIQDGDMSCQLCQKYTRCAEASDGECSVRCCISCARRWSIETSKKVDYYELVGNRIIEFDQYSQKIIAKKPIMITPQSNPYSLFMSLNKNGMLKLIGVSKQKWSELDDSKRKMYELLLKLMTPNQDSD